MKHLIVLPPKDHNIFVTREIGDTIFNHRLHLNPYGSVVYATKRRLEGETVELLDAQAEGLTYEQTRHVIQKHNPDLVTYFICAFSVPYDLQAVEWTVPHQFVLSPLKTSVKELIDVYPEFPLLTESHFISDPEWFIGKADFSFIDLTKYSQPIRINISDFCPFTCMFCCRCHMKTRVKPVIDTLEEIDYITETYGIRNFFLFGSEISINKDYTLDLAYNLQDRKIKFRTLDRVSLVEHEVYKELVQAGLTRIHFGVESGSQKCLDSMRKNIMPDQTIEAFQQINGFGLIRRAYFIVGFPVETWRDLLLSIVLAWKIRSEEVNVGVLYPSPSSPLYEQLKQQGKLLTRRWEHYKHYDRKQLVFKHEKYRDFASVMKIRNLMDVLMNTKQTKTNLVKFTKHVKKRFMEKVKS